MSPNELNNTEELHVNMCVFEHCWYCIMTSSNGNIFRVTGPLGDEFTGPGEFPTQRPVTRSFYVFFELRLNKRLSKQPWGWWFKTLSWSLWRQCNGNYTRCWDPHKWGYNNIVITCRQTHTFRCPLHVRRWDVGSHNAGPFCSDYSVTRVESVNVFLFLTT